MKQKHNWHALNATLNLSVFFIFGFLSLSMKPCFAGDFDVKELTSVAERDKARYGVAPWFRIPGTNIKAGDFRYTFISADSKEESYVHKAVLLINNSAVFYVASSIAEDEGAYGIGGDCHYGAYKGYFIMDCGGYNPSGNNHRMFLFRYGKDKVELLDVIVEAYVKKGKKVIAGLDFESVSDAYFPSDRVMTLNDDGTNPLIITEFGDFDNDTVPEIRIEISRGLKFEREFDLYLEIKNERLRVDFNPELYKPLFEHEKKMSREGEKTNAYYIYGFLSGKFTMGWIKAQLAIDKEQYDDIVPLLESRDSWDAAFHIYYEGKGNPVLKSYDIKRR